MVSFYISSFRLFYVIGPIFVIFPYSNNNSFLASVDFCLLLMLITMQTVLAQNFGHDLDPNHLTLWQCSWRKVNTDNKSMKNYPACKELSQYISKTCLKLLATLKKTKNWFSGQKWSILQYFSSADFFENNFFQKKSFRIQIRIDTLSVLILVLTVCNIKV